MDNVKLTDDQVDYIAKELDNEIKGTVLEDIANLPSNQGQETTNPEERESGESKSMMVKVDPNTGEHQIIGSTEEDELDDSESFEEMCERIKNSDIELDQVPISEKEIIDYIAKTDDSSIVGEIAKEFDISDDAIKELLKIVNRKNNHEDFNIYKAFPEEIQKMIDEYCISMAVPINSIQGKSFRNIVSEQLIDEFITNISINKVTNDFNKEIENLFSKGTTELADSIVGYTQERNEKYREYANQMQDPVKKEKIINILDQIEEGYNLSTLKEFAKKCKIKKFDLEKPNKIYDGFLRKYQDSSYNIYDIKLARPILFRALNSGENAEEFTDKDVNAFFVCFCKQVLNMSPEVVTDHAYCYYVIYNIVLIDMNKGDQKIVSDTYLENIKEVIRNLRERNNNFR